MSIFPLVQSATGSWRRGYTVHVQLPSLVPRLHMKLCVYIFRFRNSKAWERGYTFTLGFVSLIPRPLETRLRPPDIFLFSHVTICMLICSFDWQWIVVRAEVMLMVAEHLPKNGSMKLTTEQAYNLEQ